MGRTFVRKVEDFFYRIFKPYGHYRIRRLMPNVHYDIGEGIDFKRKEPFLLIGNHQYEVDSGLYAMPWKKKPITVISRSLMVSPYKKFKYKFLTSGIPKSQGEMEIHTIKAMIKTVKNNDPLFILPEGEINYFGASLPIDPSIAKLVKKLNVDVISAVSKGGHISSPRWATKLRKHRFVFVEFRVLIPKEQVKSLSVDEIHDIITEKLYVNDFDFQREKMIKVGGRRRAIGIEKFLYHCPICGGFHTIESHVHDILCNKCGAKGFIDEYGFIQGLPFDNTYDWYENQIKYREELKLTEFDSTASIYHVQYDKYRSRRIGLINLKYKNGHFHIHGAVSEIIPIEDIRYFRLTQLNVITFDYKEKHYFIRVQEHNEAFKQVTIGVSKDE